MVFRTDLAVESAGALKEKQEGVEVTETKENGCTITRIKITNEQAAEKLSKPCGNYITVEMPSISDSIDGDNTYLELVGNQLSQILPKGPVLVAGLGNRDITPDALGPKTVEQVLATRHINGELARVTGLDGLRPVAVAAPGVLGTTGIETAEMLEALINKLNPSSLVVIDALAARSLDRLGKTVQITDGGIAPGEGVGNRRPCLSKNTMGIPVIAVGVPTVVDGLTLAADLLGAEEAEKEELRHISRQPPLTVTVREVDLLISRAARMLAMAINVALNPRFTPQEYLQLVC